jgi:hypothetical protein
VVEENQSLRTHDQIIKITELLEQISLEEPNPQSESFFQKIEVIRSKFKLISVSVGLTPAKAEKELSF